MLLPFFAMPSEVMLSSWTWATHSKRQQSMWYKATSFCKVPRMTTLELGRCTQAVNGLDSTALTLRICLPSVNLQCNVSG